jgi:hypothetical protein
MSSGLWKLKRYVRLDNKGWEEFAKMCYHAGAQDDKKARFYLKRANWIHNVLHYGETFNGTNQRRK